MNTGCKSGDSDSGYKKYVLSVLTLVYTLNYLDRGLIILLLQPIKNDLRLTDTQLGFLTGIAFALFYATAGVPIARWADRGNRVTITSLAIGLWGLTVMSCVMVGNFIQLVFARIAAAIGEAGCMPPTYSLIGDLFPRAAERTRAMAFYWLANPIAGLISFAAGGWLSEMYGWRVAFFLMGVPALLVAVLVKLTVRDPRSPVSPTTVTRQAEPSMWEVLTTLWHQRSCRHLSLAIIFFFAMGLGIAPWFAAFMVRSHGMGTTEIGVWFGLIFGFGGMAGTLLGGYVIARWFAENPRGQMRLSAILIASFCPCLVLFLLLPQRYGALTALTLLVAIFNFLLGPTFAVMQRLVRDDMRATTMAVVMLLANLIGMGVGPQLVGILSDELFPILHADSLRYALLAMSIIAFVSAFHFWKVGYAVAEDIEKKGYAAALENQKTSQYRYGTDGGTTSV